MSLLFLAARAKSFDECTKVTPDCPVDATVLGYVPNLGSSIFFAVAFGLLCVASLGIGLWKRTWTYCAAVTVGVFLECIGYIGRAIMHPNVWSKTGFQVQICCIIIAPTFICAAIYLTLKHVSLALSPSLSRIPPRFYPRVFLPADLTCLVIQAIGGGVAAAAPRDDPGKAESGNRLIVAGVALQVAVLAAFGVMGLDYWVRVRGYMVRGEAEARQLAVWNDGRFRTFGVAIGVAYVSILCRCIYRIAEMAGGWGNHIMQDEPSFLVLDSTLVLVTSALLVIVHPGIYFPQMASGGLASTHAESEKEKSGESSNEAVRAESV